VSPFDGLPEAVCGGCLKQIISACEIKERCIDSDNTLRRHQIKEEDLFLTSQQDILSLGDVKDELCISSFVEFHELRERKSLSPEAAKQLPRESHANILKCYLCNANFKGRKEKYEHLESCHANDASSLKCKLCRHKSQTVRGLDNHMMLHENPDLLSHMCHVCSKNYQKACELRRHIKQAHGDKSQRVINFFCDNCDFRTFSKMNMKRHLNTIHLKIKAFVCELCPEKKYTSKITLDQHMISKHGKDSDFVCNCCHRKFPTMSFLRSHMKSTCSGSPGAVRERGDPNYYREPLGETDNYRCKLCGLVFVGKGKIAQHYAQRHKHSNACTLCSATFNSYSNLRKHIQILHNKIHKYSCTFCSRSFGQKNQLQSHM
jgi:KRAB domain-containing zinc finger protein